MDRKSIFALFIMLALVGTFVFPALSVVGQSQQVTNRSDKEKNRAAAKALRIVERYREGGDSQSNRTGKGREQTQPLAQKQERPQWATDALHHGMEQLQQNKDRYGVQDAEAEFRMVEAMKDGRGYMDVRLTQMHNGVEVFGGQLITHLDDRNALQSVSGRMFKEARINTTPKIDEAQAIEAAKAAPGHDGEFAEEPTAKLVILPHRIMTNDEKAGGATLVYLVKLQVEGGKKAGDHRFFISAKDSSVVWRFNARNSATGIGGSLYSGVVAINTDVNPDTGYTLRDPDRGHSEVFDALDSYKLKKATAFGPKTPNAWGTQRDASNRETVAVDAFYGVEQSWDYFFFKHGRHGTDGIGAGVDIYVHYVSEDDKDAGLTTTNNAFGGQNKVYFGNGDGTQRGPLVSLDTVGHEYTHCLIDDVLPDDGFIYSGESGAIDEAFSDIFGIAIGLYSGKDTGYLSSEDEMIPGGGGVADRDLVNPRSLGDPDHYSNFVNTTNDNGGVHTNSAIISHVYYLLAEGGVHRLGAVVPAIGRDTAEELFYATLTRQLTSSARFIDVANGMVQVANAYGENVRAAVEDAWRAVGVLPTTGTGVPLPVPVPDLSAGRALFYDPAFGWGETGKVDQEGKFQTQRFYGAGAFAQGWTHIVDIGNQLFFFNRDTYSCAVAQVDADGNVVTTQGFTLSGRRFVPVGRGSGRWTHVAYSNGYMFFYNENYGTAEIGEVTPGGYRRWKYYGIDTFGLGWTHIVSVQGRLMFYNTNNGVAAVGELRKTPGPNFGEVLDVNFVQLGAYQFETGWTHIVAAGSKDGVFANANQRGLMFYNAATGLYVVGDIDTETGAYTVRAPLDSRWSYSLLQPGWKHIVRMGEGLFFYGNESAMVGHLLTAIESDRLALEPFQVINIYSGNFFVGPYPMLSSTYSF
ncbi:MAG TPA: M4 family metallopeptidase [Blastocatellia bacterium]|nr:M4 family metallopeptidase [Blastocatellia bacterium]